MPLGPQPTVVSSAQGAVLVIVHVDGTSDVYTIPQSATITIQPPVGFGNVSKVGDLVDKASAENLVDQVISTFGAM
jgi:hypothetical protein